MLALGQVDAAQMLAPVPVAIALGLARSPVRFEALSLLNLNGNVIGVSQDLARSMRDAGYGFDFSDAALAGRALVASTPATLRIGVPYAFSMHVELLRYWLDACKVAPDRYDIRTVPPPQMAKALAAGDIDVFCVGEPWGSMAVEIGAGALLLPCTAIWAAAPEKVLGVRAGWATAEPDLAGRLLRSVWRAGRWLGQGGNHMMAAEVLTAPGRLAVPPDLVERALTGQMVISTQGEERHTPGLSNFSPGPPRFHGAVRRRGSAQGWRAGTGLIRAPPQTPPLLCFGPTCTASICAQQGLICPAHLTSWKARWMPRWPLQPSAAS